MVDAKPEVLTVDNLVSAPAKIDEIWDAYDPEYCAKKLKSKLTPEQRLGDNFFYKAMKKFKRAKQIDLRPDVNKLMTELSDAYGSFPKTDLRRINYRISKL